MKEAIVRLTGAMMLAGFSSAAAHAADDDPLSGSVSFRRSFFSCFTFFSYCFFFYYFWFRSSNDNRIFWNMNFVFFCIKSEITDSYRVTNLFE